MGNDNTTRRRPTADPIHVLPSDNPLPARSLVYILHCPERTIPLLVFLALHPIDGRSDFPLVFDVTVGFLPVTMELGSIHIGVISQCYCAFNCFSSCHSWTPLPLLWSALGAGCWALRSATYPAFIICKVE